MFNLDVKYVINAKTYNICKIWQLRCEIRNICKNINIHQIKMYAKIGNLDEEYVIYAKTYNICKNRQFRCEIRNI